MPIFKVQINEDSEMEEYFDASEEIEVLNQVFKQFKGDLWNTKSKMMDLIEIEEISVIKIITKKKVSKK